MLVDMWMTPDPITIEPTTSVAKAALVMAHRRVRHLAVVDHSRLDAPLVGIVSAGDVARAFPPDLNPASGAVSETSVPQPVSGIMTRAVRTVASGTAIGAAACVMRAEKIGAMPVMRGAHLIGIVTESDVFHALVEMCDPTMGGIRVTFALAEDEDVTATLADLCHTHGASVTSILAFHHRDRATGEQQRLGVVRLQGGEDQLVDALWASRHRVLSVIHE